MFKNYNFLHVFPILCAFMAFLCVREIVQSEIPTTLENINFKSLDSLPWGPGEPQEGVGPGRGEGGEGRDSLDQGQLHAPPGEGQLQQVGVLQLPP